MAEQGPIEKAIGEAVAAAIAAAMGNQPQAESTDYVPDSWVSVSTWVSRQDADSVERLMSAMTNAVRQVDPSVPADVLVEIRRVLTNAAESNGLPV